MTYCNDENKFLELNMNFLDKIASLTPFTQAIACEKATEPPRYQKTTSKTGSFLCKRCGIALFRANSEFASHCGWPSFDESLDTVTEHPDIDGIRTEIVCKRCQSHLGHVFIGENFTPKNKRYCINLAMLDYVDSTNVNDTEEAIVAAGCFWGVEFYLAKMEGVLLTEVGYIGGDLLNPSYEDVCTAKTGHYEAVRVLFDKSFTNYSNIIKRFFELHDFTQTNGQGPDIGPQYKSAIFYYNEEQKKEAAALIKQLTAKSYTVATKLLPVSVFWPAELYHQKYYDKKQKQPYCHRINKIFT